MNMKLLAVYGVGNPGLYCPLKLPFFNVLVGNYGIYNMLYDCKNVC